MWKYFIHLATNKNSNIRKLNSHQNIGKALDSRFSLTVQKGHLISAIKMNMLWQKKMCLWKDLHAHSKHTVLLFFFFSLPQFSKQWTRTKAQQRTKHLQKATNGKTMALSNLVSVELKRISKWVSAAEVVLRVKVVRQGRQRGFLKGNIRGAERKRNILKTTQVLRTKYWFK